MNGWMLHITRKRTGCGICAIYIVIWMKQTVLYCSHLPPVNACQPARSFPKFVINLKRNYEYSQKQK